ncbi:MAG: trypsin-like peptidase domain-containing protein [Anaerolineae bacterium]|nr:trypsin-like peptidase domain-containing protein [Anaerolineae bacterium]
MRIRSCIVSLLVCTLVGALLPPLPARAQDFETSNILRATVLIHQVYTNTQGDVIIACEGSGTLVSPDGLILTNAHVAQPSALCKSDRLVISLTLREGEAPVPTYYAEVVNANQGYDLAVLRIVSTLDNRPIDTSTLVLPFVELGESENVTLDNTLEIVGYTTPDGTDQGGAAAVIRGTITGFTAEARVGNRAWFKTRAPIPGGMTGGGAYDIAGKLIGIPTIEPNRSDGENIDCRLVQDSNGDGRVNRLDTCVPIGGFINAIRPSRLARGLILSAKLGLQPLVQPASEVGQVTGPARFSRLFFAPAVTAAGQPTTVVTGMPAGTTDLYLFFDYDNMLDGMIYELRVTRDGIPDATYSLAPATWSGGQRGLWYIGSSAQVWPNGVYEFSLFIDGKRTSDPAKLTVGGPAQALPSMSDILFGVQSQEQQLVSAGAVIPVGSVISAEFVFNNMTPDLQWRRVWYIDDLRLPEEPPEQWSGSSNGKRSVSLAEPPDQPFQPGRYRLEIWIGERLAVTSDVLMLGAQVVYDTQIFKDMSYTNTLDAKQLDRTVGLTFPTTITSLYATFNWRDIAPGIPWTWRWTVDDNPLFEETVPWQGAPTGDNMWIGLKALRTMPDGAYKLDLIVGGVVRATATAKVGLGQLPVTTFGTAEGIQLQGVVVDAETGEGIPGVQVILLKVEYAVADFTRDRSEIYDLSITDTQGQFSMSRLLARDSRPYSMIVLAQGYLPLSSDNITIDDKTANPLVLRMELNKD